MRTTVTLADDVAAALAELRARRGIGVSEALNELVRAGLRRPRPRRAFRQRHTSLALKIDVSNVGRALEILEGPTHR